MSEVLIYVIKEVTSAMFDQPHAQKQGVKLLINEEERVAFLNRFPSKEEGKSYISRA